MISYRYYNVPEFDGYNARSDWWGRCKGCGYTVMLGKPCAHCGTYNETPEQKRGLEPYTYCPHCGKKLKEENDKKTWTFKEGTWTTN